MTQQNGAACRQPCHHFYQFNLQQANLQILMVLARFGVHATRSLQGWMEIASVACRWAVRCSEGINFVRQQLKLPLSVLGGLESILTPTLAPKMQAGLLGDLDWSGKHQATIRLLRPPEGSSEEPVGMEPRSTSYELSVSLFIG